MSSVFTELCRCCSKPAYSVIMFFLMKNKSNAISRLFNYVLMKLGKRKFHYIFRDGQEMAEEYSIETNVLLRRAWKKKNPIRGSGDWEVEVGDPEPQFGAIDDIGIKENSSTPYVTRRITKTSLEWRIRNLPYPVETYSVTADLQDRCLVVRTTNKKYFKKLSVPELERVSLPPAQENVSFSHKYNTLIIVYKKPPQVLEMERQIMEELTTVAAIKDDQSNLRPQL